MAFMTRLSDEDDKALKALAEGLGLMPIDIIRAAVKGVLVAARENGGSLEFPVRVVTMEQQRELLNLIGK